jgi:hypothetical protein
MSERQLFYFKNRLHISDDISRDDFLGYRDSFDPSIGEWCYCTRRLLVNPFQEQGCHRCQDLIKWQSLIFLLSDELHLVDELLEVRMGKSAHGCVSWNDSEM